MFLVGNFKRYVQYNLSNIGLTFKPYVLIDTKWKH
jgi:hypothetical protein